ncbi:MAG: hypothetical protein H6R01_629 [Burkholderiaceae bacterium]|nr:hypothetical protein [Burkholderiaceae bacterium]
MNTKIGKAIGAIVVIIALAIAGYWYWSPFLALKQMHTAVIKGDAGAFNEAVDFPKLRESLKGQFSAMLAKQVAKQSESGNPYAQAGANLGAALGMAMANSMVEAMVRPEFVMNILKEGRLKKHGQQAPNQQAAPEAKNTEKKPEWDYERKGVNQIVVFIVDRTKKKEEQPSLVFERYGFATWKLTEIRLPDLMG